MPNITTLDEVKKLIPSKSNYVTQDAVDIINASINEPEFQGESLLQTASLYSSVLKGSRASIPEYLRAVKFCAYMITNDSQYTEAYKKVFCDRKFVKERLHVSTDNPKYGELTSAASRYRRSKLVIDILTISQVPLDMIFAGSRYKAIAVLATVMENSRYDRDRINAAKELLAATKGADNIKIELDVGIKEDSTIKQLNDQLANMAARQKSMLESGAMSLEEFGSLKVIEHEPLEDK